MKRIINTNSMYMKRRISLLIIVVVAVATAIILIFRATSVADNAFLETNVEALSDDESFGPEVNCFSSVSDSYDPELYLEVRKCLDCKIMKTSHFSNPWKCNI